MKITFSMISFLLLFSCNNAPDYVLEVEDSAVAIPVTDPIPEHPVLTTEEKLSNNLQKFANQEIDSLSAEDILDIVKDILEALHEIYENGDWEKTKECYENTESTMKKSEKGANIFLEHQADFNTIKNKIEEARLELVQADKYLKRISAEGRWEKLRKSFQIELNNNGFSKFSPEQQNEFKQILSDWDDYKEKNKLAWYRNDQSNIEDLFFDYSKYNAKTKAAWGYIIQQVDWNGAVDYYTNIAPDPKAMGKPYYMLKYYYNTIDRGYQFEDFYDDKTNEVVNDLCPQEH